jgi:hypothetical protein
MDEQAALRFREETKQALMQAVRHFMQKKLNTEKAAKKLQRAQRLQPALVPQAAAVLKFAEEAEEEAYHRFANAADMAIQAGWSAEDRVFFAQEAEEQIIAADAAGRRGSGAQGGGRRKTRKTRAARKRSTCRKSTTRKYKSRK